MAWLWMRSSRIGPLAGFFIPSPPECGEPRSGRSGACGRSRLWRCRHDAVCGSRRHAVPPLVAGPAVCRSAALGKASPVSALMIRRRADAVSGQRGQIAPRAGRTCPTGKRTLSRVSGAALAFAAAGCHPSGPVWAHPGQFARKQVEPNSGLGKAITYLLRPLERSDGVPAGNIHTSLQ